MSAARFDAIWLDAGGVLVLPDPTVFGPLLAPHGGDPSIARHRRAHYAAMAVKSAQGADELDWVAYDEAYCESIGVPDHDIADAAHVLGQTRHALLWRWPIPESVAGLRRLHNADVPLGVVSNAAGQIEGVLARYGVCQVGDGPGVPVRVIVDSAVVGVAKPNPRIFDHAAAHFSGIPFDRIAYVGDSVTMDIAVARAAGLHPILVDPYDDHAGADYDRIHQLSDLLDAVQGTNRPG
jgi:putative hydrolase of the HAD superfamily